MRIYLKCTNCKRDWISPTGNTSAPGCRSMHLSMMNGFLKREDCPSSFELVSFQKGELSRERGLGVRRHLERCDFCDAEVDLYLHYPFIEAPIETPQMPAPLFELAEALLKGKHSDGVALNALLRDGLVPEKV